MKVWNQNKMVEEKSWFKKKKREKNMSHCKPNDKFQWTVGTKI